MKAIILDIPTTPIFITPELKKLSEELKAYRMYDQQVRLEKEFGIKFPPANSYNRGLLFIAAILEENGIKVCYYNSDFNHDFWKECEKQIPKADFVLASAKTNNYDIILKYLKICKQLKPQIITILGGPHPTALVKECLRNRNLDFIIKGEGEETLREFLSVYKKANFSKVRGLAYKQNNKIFENEDRLLISVLDKIPMPAYHLLPGGLESYHPYIDTSRGCLYDCHFCSGPSYWCRKLRTRSFSNFYKELKLIKSLIKDFNFVHISDPMLGVTVKQIEILRKLTQIKHGLFFSCDVKANYVTVPLIKIMVKSGIKVFSIGIETLNNRSLIMINKNSTSQEEIRACKIIKSIKDTYIKSYWIFGLPGENKTSLKKMVKEIYLLLKRNIVDQICSHILIPYPGTDLFNKSKKLGIEILHKQWRFYEGRSYPLVYKLTNLTGKEIYQYFLMGQKQELKFYLEKYGDKILSNSLSTPKSISFGNFKGRLL